MLLGFVITAGAGPLSWRQRAAMIAPSASRERDPSSQNAWEPEASTSCTSGPAWAIGEVLGVVMYGSW
jgi:hypothetical protein